MQAKECAEYISSKTDIDKELVKVDYPRKFNYYRILISVDEDGMVTNIPQRG